MERDRVTILLLFAPLITELCNTRERRKIAVSVILSPLRVRRDI